MGTSKTRSPNPRSGKSVGFFKMGLLKVALKSLAPSVLASCDLIIEGMSSRFSSGMWGVWTGGLDKERGGFGLNKADKFSALGGGGGGRFLIEVPRTDGV